MPTNQLDELSQTQKIFISNEDEWRNYPNRTRYFFYCRECEKESSVVKFTKTRYITKQLQFLCTNCLKKKTTMEHYGVDNPAKCKEIQDKMKSTMMEKYGVEHNFQAGPLRDKIIQGFVEKYGVTCPVHSKEISEKIKQTLIDKYGIPHPPIFKYIVNDMPFDSSWEVAFYIYHIDHNIHIKREPKSLSYVYNDKEHFYNPDFEVNGQLYEIKGDQYFKEDGTMCNPYDHSQDAFLEAKHQCGLQNNVIFLKKKDIKPYIDYMKSAYGKDWSKKYLRTK